MAIADSHTKPRPVDDLWIRYNFDNSYEFAVLGDFATTFYDLEGKMLRVETCGANTLRAQSYRPVTDSDLILLGFISILPESLERAD